jgi:hypothetical protein
MKRSRPSAGIACAVLAAACLAIANGRAAYVPPPPDVHEQPKLPPELEKRVDEFYAKLRSTQKDLWEARMKQEIADIAKTTNLGADGQKKLEAPAQQAIDISLDPWLGKTDWGLRKILSTASPMQAKLIMDQRFVSVSGLSHGLGVNVLAPWEQDVWRQALRQVLTPDQLAAWEKVEADRRAAAEKEVADALKMTGDNVRESRTNGLLTEAKHLEMVAGLDADQSAKLESLVKTVVDISMQKWQDRNVHEIDNMDAEARHQVASQRTFWLDPDSGEMPDKQPEWTDGIAQILSSDQKARMAAADEVTRQRRAHALAQILVMILDQKIAFTEAQRQKLIPLAEHWVQAETDLFPSAAATYYPTSLQVYYSAACRATDVELKPILDDLQVKHWRDVTTSGTDSVPDESQTDSAGDTGPVDVDKAISDFLYAKAEKERTRSLVEFVIKAEDAVRVVGLGADAAAQLQVAARGAHEEYLSSWRWFTEQQIRSQLQDVTPQNVKARLDSIQEVFFQQRMFGPFGSNLDQNWENTVRAELSVPQRDVWQKELDARADFRSSALADYVMAEFDRQYALTPAQYDKLSPILARVVHDNADAIAGTFGGFGDTPWYLQGFYTLIPMMGISEKDLGDALSKDQMKRWTSSQEYMSASNFWNNIQQMQKNRVQIQGMNIR